MLLLFSMAQEMFLSMYRYQQYQRDQVLSVSVLCDYRFVNNIMCSL